MNISDYQLIIGQTAVYPKEFGKGYCVLGLTGEFTEFLNALENETVMNQIKECGDVWWYLTAIVNEWRLDVSYSFPEMVSHDDACWYDSEGNQFENADESLQYNTKLFFQQLGVLSEVTKKFYRDGTVPEEKEIDNIIWSMSMSLYHITLITQLDINVVLQMNYDKLIKRRETNTLHGSGSNREEQIDGKHI